MANYKNQICSKEIELLNFVNYQFVKYSTGVFSQSETPDFPSHLNHFLIDFTKELVSNN